MRVSEPTFNLENFEGPLDLLLHLIENKELDIYQVPIERVTSQYLNYLNTLMKHDLDLSAEFLSLISSLMLLKSKMLLPADQVKIDPLESELRFEIIEQLLHYYKFKDIAIFLQKQEEKQGEHFSRAVPHLDEDLKQSTESELFLSESEIELSKLFHEVLEKAKLREKGLIIEETYKVSDKIKEWRSELALHQTLKFEQIFTAKKSRGELIALFIALLELIKLGEIITDWDQQRLLIKRGDQPE